VRTVLARLLLAVAVVLFQHGAVAHVLMHVGEEAGHEQDDGDFHAPHGCDACHAYVAAEGGEPPAALLLPVEAAPALAVARAAAAPASEPPHDFRIRAPPARA
jgi:hypothetical protein